jgi:hypothetical protein
MDKTILFPNRASDTLWAGAAEQYYATHYMHVKNYLDHVGKVDIITADTTLWDDRHNNNFYVDINGERIIFDYSDFSYHTLNLDELSDNIKYFKIHTTKESHPKCLPFPAMSFPDWKQYYQLKNTIKYNPNGNIFYKCRIYGGAVERRQAVMNKLKSYSNLRVDFSFVEQEKYFRSFNNCRINVIVPGARPDILDRTHMQSFALGIPVITSKMSTLLPFGEEWIPNVDYIECDDNFTNIIDVINQYKFDKKYLDYISNNSRIKFEKTCTPTAVKEWILHNIENN